MVGEALMMLLMALSAAVACGGLAWFTLPVSRHVKVVE
jgi:hypothetical protein